MCNEGAKDMHKEFLMGNAAIALGAIAAGLNLTSGYPGTPSTEVLETVAKHRPDQTYVEWSVNEKAALEVAAGAAYAGARTMVTMKQVGLNVASDPLMSLEYIGVKGGMVIMVADDPGPISSQTEQDTRHFAAFSKLPCFDPTSVQEAYDMIQDAFEISEKFGTPVFFRPTTRICHAYASIDVKDESEYKTNAPEGFIKDSRRWVIFPRLSNANHRKIEARNVELSDVFSEYERNELLFEKDAGANAAGFSHAAEQSANELPAETTGTAENAGASGFSPVVEATGNTASICPKRGIAAGGIGYALTREVLKGKDAPRTLKIATPHPFPEKLAVRFLEGLDEVLCIEELDPVIERELTYIAGKYHLPVRILGKLTHDTENAGENSIDLVEGYIRKFLEWDKKDRANDSVSQAVPSQDGTQSTIKKGAADSQNGASDKSGDTSAPNRFPAPPALPIRPPVLCAGCPHRASFYAVKRAMQGKKTIFCGDIGCYTLGNAMPLDMCDTCLCMGAGINIAQGVKHIEPDTSAFAFVGDSTFFASAITGIVNAVYNQAEMTVVILDNSTTAMTGHQPHPGTGRTMMGDVVAKINIEKVLRGIGLKFVETVDPLDLTKAIKTVKHAVAEPGVKAIIFKSPCVAIVKPNAPLTIDQAKCIKCKRCIREIGCPGIVITDGNVQIDDSLCTGCTLCSQICPTGAIGGGLNE
jgi:indolepyruvate ferredoxin oxidoreductase alpha subunit